VLKRWFGSREREKKRSVTHTKAISTLSSTHKTHVNGLRPVLKELLAAMRSGQTKEKNIHMEMPINIVTRQVWRQLLCLRILSDLEAILVGADYGFHLFELINLKRRYRAKTLPD
jgi:hypothetical protein